MTDENINNVKLSMVVDLEHKILGLPWWWTYKEIFTDEV